MTKINKIISESIRKVFLSEEVRLSHPIDLPEDITTIKNILKKAGYKTYVVGGAVRDSLLGKAPKDFDLATDALPDTVQDLLKPYYKTLETGKSFGVINVLTPSGEYEIATFRKDLGKGRRPDAVEFTSIDQDVKRRDLTINALFYDIDTREIVDLVGGIEDLKKGIVRTVGSPEERFDEDRLRILRAIRFAGRFGSELDPAVDASLKKDSSLENISGERIRDEFIKGIKSSKSVIHFLNMIQKYDLFKWIFGPLKYNTDFIEERNIPVLLSHMLKGNSIDQVKKELNNLKYSADEVSQISFLLSFLSLSLDTAYKLKKAQANSKLSDSEILDFAKWENMDLSLVKSFLNWKLSVTGQELMDLGFKGADLGKEMERREIENFKEFSTN